MKQLGLKVAVFLGMENALTDNVKQVRFGNTKVVLVVLPMEVFND
jgi:hypothetical protein